ncbi:MAG: helix-turn-helix domain-containing protein [Cytophagales bacterium]|jgi:excisionase family DNA binding protein|nr:helix-turn-helix domain-containing protein [Cytophagales bacterium]
MQNVTLQISIPEALLQSLIEDEVRKVIRQRAEAALVDDRVMGAEEAAQYLNISRTTLWRKCSELAVPHSKNGSKLMFRKSELDAWVTGSKRKTASTLEMEAANYTMQSGRRV